MKTALPTLFFLFAFITATHTSSTSEFLQDQDGDPIPDHGGPYYFLSTLGDGGLEIAGTVNETCTLSVVQVADNSEGLALTMSRHRQIIPVPLSAIFIKTEEFVSIIFDRVILSHWMVENGSVKVEFEEESPKMKDKFIFKEAQGGNGYAILYCLKADDNCKYLKLVPGENNHKRLILGDVNPSDEDLHVVFKKKNRTHPEISMV